MVDEDVELPGAAEPSPAAPAPAAPAPAPAPARRMMGLDDLKRSSARDARAKRGPMPKIPKLKPLRPYDTAEGKAFLDDIKAERLPRELRKLDEAGRPVPVSIAIEDVRPKSYAEVSKVIEAMEAEVKREQQEEAAAGRQAAAAGPALFVGAGHSLSGGAAASGNAGGNAAGASGGAGADPALVALVAAGPAPEVDEAKAKTTVQLRLASGARVKACLNQDHTVADLWRLVAKEMGGLEAFKAASGHALVAGFPPKPLTDTSATLAAADLCGAAVTHRLG
eukprot:TRINITY_DN18615_c0_g1_i1.p1 TRINITY_DN18615_c0_g1~~TRINITY_DN18615_c0_g1_i1.p1  ORF type:complete len:311 (-),score=101.36 TRINITY_DN18615_c0_g1_i1:95-934(-)